MRNWEGEWAMCKTAELRVRRRQDRRTADNLTIVTGRHRTTAGKHRTRERQRRAELAYAILPAAREGVRSEGVKSNRWSYRCRMADGVRSKQPHHRLVLSPLRRLASPCEGDGGLGGCRSGLRLENGILGWAAGLVS
nr:hypothetical protein Iba_chr07bCG7450 [Ipomoea batatas]